MQLARTFIVTGALAGLAMASTSVPGITSVTKLAGTSLNVSDTVFTRANPSANNLGGITGISANQPQVWFERQLIVPNVSYQGGAKFGGVKVDWLGGADQLSKNYSITASGAGGGILTGPTTAFDTSRVLKTGTSVNSYYFYSSRSNAATAGNSVYAAQIVFTQPVLGVIVNNGFTPPAASANGKLNATNAAFGRPGVTNYPATNSVGMEGTGDRLRIEQLGPSAFRLTFQITSNGLDNMRILTATPEPAAWAAFAIIWIVLVAAARRRRAASADC